MKKLIQSHFSFDATVQGLLQLDNAITQRIFPIDIANIIINLVGIILSLFFDSYIYIYK